MSYNRFHSFLERLFWGENLLYQNRDKTPIIRQREPNPDELALGWAEGVDEETGQPVIQSKGVPQAHRDTHMYVIGGSRTGKTRYLQSFILQDIGNHQGFGVFDPHGDLYAETLGALALLPDIEEIKDSIVLIDPTHPTRTATFNPLERVSGASVPQQAGELVHAMKKIWADSWGARMEDLLRNALIALIEKNLTLLELSDFISDKDFRIRVLKGVVHPICIGYFRRFDQLTGKTSREWSESTLNKVNAFLSDDFVRHIFMAKQSSFNLRDIMDTGKMLLVRLDKGRLGDTADLLGGLLLAKLKMAAFRRTEIADKADRRLFYLYLDEFQNYASDSFADILSEAAKYRLSLILAHQHLSQLPSYLQDSILTNCALQIFFRIMRADAQILSKEALTSIYTQPPGWEQYIQDMQNLLPRFCFVKNKIEGGAIKVYTPDVLAPHEQGGITAAELAERIEQSGIGDQYTRPRADIEAEWQERMKTLGLTEEAEEDWDTFGEPEKPETFREPKNTKG